MLKNLARSVLALPLVMLACSSSTPGGGGAGTLDSGASSGGAAGGGTTGTGGATGTGGVSDGGVSSGGATGMGGAPATTDGGDDAVGAADGSVQSFLPAGYKGTPFKVLTIPGTIHTADYDLGGAGVAYCHAANNCGANIMTTDWTPAGTLPYRPPPSPGDKVAGGAAAIDNAGICHMDGRDKTTEGVLVTPPDVFPCWTVTGEWLKYTVRVQQAGTYSISAFVGSPAGVTVSLDFGGGIMTGPFPIPTSPTANCKCTETYHSWQPVDKLAMVTFPTAGTYLMTFTIVTKNLNLSTFTFTKM